MNGLTYDALKHAWSRLDKAAELLGRATPDELATWVFCVETLAAEHGVAAEYAEVASLLIAEGVPSAPARVAAYWAVRRIFGADERVTSELDGPTDAEISAQRLALEADREEAETGRFYREDFPGVAAARGQRVEDSPAWRMFAGDGPAEAVEFCIPSPFVTLRAVPLHEVPSSRQVDWSAEQIRDEYRRFWSTAERRLWDAEYKAAKPHAAGDLEAARFATRRVLDRRVAIGTGRAADVAPRSGAVA